MVECSYNTKFVLEWLVRIKLQVLVRVCRFSVHGKAQLASPVFVDFGIQHGYGLVCLLLSGELYGVLLMCLEKSSSKASEMTTMVSST